MSRSVRFEAPRRVALVDGPDPDLAAGEVRVATMFSGISAGTELTYYRGTNPYFDKHWDAGLRLFRATDAADGGAVAPGLAYPVDGKGSEEVGVVVEVGAGVRELAPGELVWGKWGHRDLAVMAADYLRVRTVAPGMAPIVGVFSQIGAIALNVVLDADLHVGETVAVFGLGVLGQIVAQLARLNGADVIAVDPHADRRGVAAALGTAQTLDARAGDIGERIRELTDGRGVDAALEVSGSYEGLREAVRSVRYNSRVVAAGFFQGRASALALGEEFHHNRVELRCSQISSVAPQLSWRWNDERLQRTVMSLAAAGRLELERLVTDVVPFEEADRAFALLDGSADRGLAVVLQFPAPPGGVSGSEAQR